MFFDTSILLAGLVEVGLPKRQGAFEVYLAALDSKEHRRMMTAGSAPIYADPGYLLFASGDRLVAQQFDAARLQSVGEIVPLGDVAPVSVFDGAPALSASANGVLAHATTIPPNTGPALRAGSATRSSWRQAAGSDRQVREPGERSSRTISTPVKTTHGGFHLRLKSAMTRRIANPSSTFDPNAARGDATIPAPESG